MSRVRMSILIGMIGCGFVVSNQIDHHWDDPIEIRDDAGRVRIRIGHLGDDEYGTMLFDSSGQVRGRLSFSGTLDETYYEIRDGQGEEVAMVIGTHDGLAKVRVGSAQSPRAELSIMPDGVSGVSVFDGRAREGATIGVTEAGDASRLVMLNPAESEHSIVALETLKERAYVGVSRAGGRDRIDLEQGRNGISKLTISENDTLRVGVGVDGHGGAGVNVNGSDGKVRLVFQDNSELGSGLVVVDAEGEPRATVGLNASGEANLKIRDGAGGVVFEAPDKK